MQCPFCGSHVSEGFTVCKGCGASYVKNNANVVLGFWFVALAVFPLLFGFVAGAVGGDPGVLLGIGGAVAAIGVVIMLIPRGNVWVRSL